MFVKNKRKLKNFISRIILHFEIYFAQERRLLIGADITQYPGWIASQEGYLNICKYDHLQRVLGKKKLKHVLAEHVLEHIDLEELKQGLINIFNCLEENGTFRIAVPDGFHQSSQYIDAVKPGGSGWGSEDHKHLFNYQSLSQLLKECGFTVEVIEYWTQGGDFQTTYCNDDGLGYIDRSFINDARNSDGKPNYTSLIIDAHKILDNE